MTVTLEMGLLCLGVFRLQALCEPNSRWASASIYCNFYPHVGLFIPDLGKRRGFAETQLKPIISTLSQQQVAGEKIQLGAINAPTAGRQAMSILRFVAFNIKVFYNPSLQTSPPP